MKIPASKVPAQVWADKARRRADLDEVESMLLSSWDDSKQVYRIGKELWDELRIDEADEGTDWIDKLLTCDKAALTPTQFHEVSALSSVINMDYQICNGGISQYVFNGYHEDCAPYSDDDVAHLGQSGQVAMLRELASFGDEAFPASRDENGAIRRWAGEFRFLDWFSLFKVDGCERTYFGLSGHVAFLCEAYAQYLCKSYGIA